MDHLLNIFLYVVDSGSAFIVVPCVTCAVCALFGLVARLIRGNYRGIHV